MEGGNIVRRIGGESIKRAKKSLILESTHDNLTFYSAKQVVMSGEQGGVEYLNDYKPPEPLQVIHIEGPLNEEGEKVSTVEKGKSYKIKITQFNRELKSPAELMKIKWSLQLNNDAVQLSAKTIGKQEVTLDISKTDSLDKITIYAYISNWKKEGKCEVNVSTKQGGIHTRFYDEQGQQIYDIPKKLQKAFNEEYGIKIAYDKENEMLYYKGECAPAYEKISPTAIAHWKRELSRDQISKGKLLFGYNFGYKIRAEPISNNWSGYKKYSFNDFDDNGNVLYLKKEEGAVSSGIVPGIPEVNMQVVKELKMKEPSPGIKIGDIAFIDLADFDDNLNQKGWKYIYTLENKYKQCKIDLPKTDRYFNLPRILEHEFIGHAILKLSDKAHELAEKEKEINGPVPVEAKLGNIIRREINLPDRIIYISKREDSLSVNFGYLNGSNDPDPNMKPIIIFDEERGYRTINHPPEFPKDHGRFEINRNDVDKLLTIKYYKTIKYDVHKKNFDFD